MSLRAAGLIIFRVVSQEVEYLLMKAAPPLNHWTPPKGSLHHFCTVSYFFAPS